jgi:hypothetical protein
MPGFREPAPSFPFQPPYNMNVDVDLLLGQLRTVIGLDQPLVGRRIWAK